MKKKILQKQQKIKNLKLVERKIKISHLKTMEEWKHKKSTWNKYSNQRDYTTT